MAAPAFDAAAQVAVWLARIPAAQRTAAQAAMDWRMIVWVMGGLVMIGIAALIARNGSLTRLRAWTQSRGPSPWLASAALAGATALILLAARAMLDGLADWRAEAVLAQAGGYPNTGGFDVHVAEAASGVPFGVLAAMLLVPPWLWLMKRRPRTWPLICGGLVGVVILGFTWLPYAMGVTPTLPIAEPGPARSAVQALIDQTHLPSGPVLLHPTAGLDGDVIGGFGHVKVLMGGLLVAAPPDQASAYMAHVMGHYVHNDILVVCLLTSLVMLAGFVAMQRWGLTVARLMSRRAPEDPADPEMLPALAVIGMLTLTVAGLVGAAYLRFANVEADGYSLENARAPDGLAAILERTWDHAAVDPNPFETAVFYTHPPLASRIAHAMAWKASHGN